MEAEFVYTAVFYSSYSRELVFVAVASFNFFNVIIEKIIKITISSRGNNGIDICSDGNLSDSEYVDDVALLSEDLR